MRRYRTIYPGIRSYPIYLVIITYLTIDSIYLLDDCCKWSRKLSRIGYSVGPWCGHNTCSVITW
jgi:hypothetical protein